MIKRTLKATRWSINSNYLNYFLAILVGLILFNVPTVSAASTVVIAKISPVRYAYLDYNDNIVKIDSNSPGLTPYQIFWVNYLGQNISPTSKEKSNYNNIIKNLNTNKIGTIYDQAKPLKNNKFFIKLESRLPIFSRLFLF